MRDEPIAGQVGLSREAPPHAPLGLSSDAPKFYFLTVFWGNQFRGVFADFCLPSLLAEQNIPAIKNRHESRFVIVTTSRDWAEFTRHPIFERLSRLIEPMFVELTVPEKSLSRGETQLLSSAGHKLATHVAFRDSACAIIVAPDVIFSNGSIATLQQRAERGSPMVQALGLRAEQDGLTADLRRRGVIRPGEALTLPPRETVHLLLRHMHSELKVYEWDSDIYFNTPVSSFWRVPDGSGIVVHSLGYTPIYVDYRRLKTHQTGSLETSTIDGAYLYDNFGDSEIDIIQDSDELMQLSMTREADYTYPLSRSVAKRLPVLGYAVKLCDLHRFSRSSFDPLRRKAFLNPIRLHSGELSTVWRPVELRAARITAAVAADDRKAIRVLVAVIQLARSLRRSWAQRSVSHTIAAVADLLEVTSPPLYRFARKVYGVLLVRRLLFFILHPWLGTKRALEELGLRRKP